MKSLLISSVYYPPQVGGISHMMASIASAMGPDRVCCLTGVQPKGALPGSSIGPRIYRRPTAFAGAKALRSLCWSATLTQIMLREQPQAVQIATVYDGSIALWLRRWFKLPFVVYAYGNEILHVLQGSSDHHRRVLHQADRVLAISRATADSVRKAGVHSDRIGIVHPGCDVSHFRPLPPKIELRQKLLGTRSGRVILTIGNLVERKGHDTVIQALPAISRKIPDATYLIVGDGPYRMQLETLAASTGVRDRVIFAGSVPSELLPDVYALSDVFVMPSRERIDACDIEGFGMVFLEANACGKPVVGGRSGGIPEAIVEGVTGLLVRPQDPEDVANVVTQLLSDDLLAARLGQQGRTRVVSELDWPQVGDRVQRILESIPPI